MSQRASTELRADHLMDAPVTVSNIAFFRGVQMGYQAYQNEQPSLSEQDLYEHLVHRLLAFPASTYENTGWVIGWVKGLLETSSFIQQTPSDSPDRRSEEPTPYGDNFLPVILNDNQRHSFTYPFCSDPSCPCHEDQSSIAQVAQYVNAGLLTLQEASDHVAGKHF
ncbi:hypothetical protein KSC_056870 [Ktedonobacter sp. SOSP1-52]|uniref:hypothetical protein n=1 Tax=Ktedonobacter sp. SOSP1-52 TaxID=2778366 RepID=UPI001A31E26D|nr:hypothetical protein [Ktedonobacter sp. SOSP1-52]GHO66795.1 hypothetical protein KSC_056870 [Ktedonobacter sp. SOSP1-52]